MVRPLPEDLLTYAVRDIVLLGYVREEFKRRGYLDNAVVMQQQSARYISLHDRGRPRGDDYFQGSHLLPLEILQAPAPRVPRTECTGCHRMLTQRSFGQGEWRSLGAMCRVCRTLVETRGFRSPPFVPVTVAPVPVAAPAPVPVAEERASSPESITSDDMNSSTSSRSSSPLITPTNSPPGSHARLRHSCPPKTLRSPRIESSSPPASSSHSVSGATTAPTTGYLRGSSLPHISGKAVQSTGALASTGVHAYWADQQAKTHVPHNAECEAAWRTYICSSLVQA